VEGIIALLDYYIKQAYEVNLINSTINMLKNGIYMPALKNAYKSMKDELPEKIKDSHKAAQVFLNAVYTLDSDSKATLAVLLMEKAAQCQKYIDELAYRLDEISTMISNENGVVPNVVSGVIPMTSANRNAENSDLESKYIDLFQEKAKVEFANNLYTNYAAYLGYTRNQMEKK